MDPEIPWTRSAPLPAKYRKPPKKRKDSRPSFKYREPTPAALKREAQQKAKNDRMAALEASKPFVVNLRRSHNVNGQVIGPGSFKLPGLLARELQAREYHADRQEEVFRGERAAIIGGRTRQGSHRVTFVPVETFNDSYGNAQPVDQVSGRGLPDPGQGSKF